MATTHPSPQSAATWRQPVASLRGACPPSISSLPRLLLRNLVNASAFPFGLSRSLCCLAPPRTPVSQPFTSGLLLTLPLPIPLSFRSGLALNASRSFLSQPYQFVAAPPAFLLPDCRFKCSAISIASCQFPNPRNSVARVWSSAFVHSCRGSPPAVKTTKYL